MLESTKSQISALLTAAGEVLLGKQDVIKLTFCALFSRSHILIEDLPGVGKTTLAHLVGQLTGLSFQRIQFTSDLLPADILGVSVYEKQKEQFAFHPGPVFTQILLADEINRATPKTQSALLEGMEEKQVTVDGNTYPLPEPFFVIATQNPQSHIGTFSLPESQLDRFIMSVSIGYPDPASERQLLEGVNRRQLLQTIKPVITTEDLAIIQKQAEEIFVSPALLDYCQSVIAYTRNPQLFLHGLSPRAGLALLQAAKSHALIQLRDEVLPEDLQAVIPAVVNHRLLLLDNPDSGNPAQQILDNVEVP
jgi:MoxR-like ATPase